MSSTLPDQITAHESVPDEAHVGRFSRGLETTPLTAARKLHRGRYSEGLERRVQTLISRRPGRFSDGLEALPDLPSKARRGSFADGQARRPAGDEPID